MLVLTEADVGKKVIIGTPTDPRNVMEEYPEQLATVLQVHHLLWYDEEPGDADWAQVQIDPSTNYDIEAWFSHKKKVVVPIGAPGGRVEATVPFCCILRFA